MLQSVQKITVSVSENSLLDAMKALRFGEIKEVDVANGTPRIDRMLTVKQVALIEFIRDGNRHIDKLVVHEGEPMQVETRMNVKGFQCIRKIRM
jgi:hypothetical protein